MDREAAFARIKASREFVERDTPQRHERLPKHGAVHKWLLSIIFAMFIGGTLMVFAMIVVMSGIFGAVGFEVGGRRGSLLSIVPLCMALVPLAMAGIGAYALVMLRKKIKKIETAPVESIPVIVVDKRTLVTGGGESSARTEYFVTCELEAGQRREFQLWNGPLYAKMTGGDQGVLFTRADYGLDFDRVAG
jgi:hypothetical protein